MPHTLTASPPVLAGAAGRIYCEDCRHCIMPGHGPAYARCDRGVPALGGDIFVARELDQPGFASSQRAIAERCGPEAKWFEPKAPEPPAEQVAA